MPSTEQNQELVKLRAGIKIQSSHYLTQSARQVLLPCYENDQSDVSCIVQLQQVLSNLDAIIIQCYNYLQAYKKLSPGKDETWLFKHRLSGLQKAEASFSHWKSELMDYLQCKLSQTICNTLKKEKSIDSSWIQMLTEKLQGFLFAYFDKLILSVGWSGSQEYSFDNFVKLFHQQFFNQQGLIISLLDPVPVRSIHDIEHLLDEQTFSSQEIENLRSDADKRLNRPDLSVVEFAEGAGHQPYLSLSVTPSI